MEIFIFSIIFGMLFGIIPAAIAHNKGRNFFLWWIYGAALFIVALPHALLMKPDKATIEKRQLEQDLMKKCPYCAEIIKREAIVCRYCSRELEERKNTQDLIRDWSTASEAEKEKRVAEILDKIEGLPNSAPVKDWNIIEATHIYNGPSGIYIAPESDHTILKNNAIHVDGEIIIDKSKSTLIKSW